MRSGRPKILHLLGGQPLVRYPVALARDAGVAGSVVVVAPRAEAVRTALADLGPRFVEQPEPRGTGDALRRARPALPDSATELLLLYGDVPLLARPTLDALLARHRASRAAATVLTFLPADPTGYGRIRRGRDGRVRAIVEERDATPTERRGRECNSGIYCFDPARLWPALEAVARPAPTNAQGEVYLTDVIAQLARRGRRIEAVRVADPLEVAGVNDRRQLAALEGLLRSRTLDALMTAGVSIIDPAATYVDTTVVVGRDTVLHPGVRLAGRTAIGEACVIGTGSQVTDTTIGDRVTLRPYCVLDESQVEDDATLGPFARLRRGSRIGLGAEVGNFIEIKQATLGRRVKAHHCGVHRRRHRGRGCQHWRRHGDVQLRRPPEAPDADRGAGVRRHELEPGRAAHDRGRRVRGGGLRDHPRRAGRRAGHGAGAAGDQGGLDGAAPEPPLGRERARRPEPLIWRICRRRAE